MSTLTKDLTVKVPGCLDRIPCDRLPDFDNLVGQTDGYQMGATSGFTPLGLRRQGLSPFRTPPLESCGTSLQVIPIRQDTLRMMLRANERRAGSLVGPHLGTQHH